MMWAGHATTGFPATTLCYPSPTIIKNYRLTPAAVEQPVYPPRADEVLNAASRETVIDDQPEATLFGGSGINNKDHYDVDCGTTRHSSRGRGNPVSRRQGFASTAE